MNHLDSLESKSIYILREAFSRVRRLAMLWSIGKDSNVMLWLTRKAFLGHVPFPVVHVDTTYKLLEMIAFRDRYAKEGGLDLIVASNDEALRAGMNHHKGRVVCCSALKTEPLRRIVAERGFTGIIAGRAQDKESEEAFERLRTDGYM